MTHCVDAVYVEDVLRAGYFCDDIGNLLVPSSDAIKAFLEAFKGAPREASQSLDRSLFKYIWTQSNYPLAPVIAKP